MTAPNLFCAARIAASETPNALTADTIRKADKNEVVFYASPPSDLFKQLGI